MQQYEMEVLKKVAVAVQRIETMISSLSSRRYPPHHNSNFISLRTLPPVNAFL